jgi:hypothetical protein
MCRKGEPNIEFRSENLEGRDSFGVNRRIILKWNLLKEVPKMGTGLNWLKTGPCYWLICC